MSTPAMNHLQAQATRRWDLDPTRSVIEFSVRAMWGLSTISGRFDRFDGSYTVGPSGAKLELTVDVTSLDVGAAAWQDALRTQLSHAVAEYRQVRFTSTRIVARGDGTLQVAGEVEAGEATHAVEGLATIREADGDIEVESATTVERFGSGMPNGPLGLLRPPATLHVKARFT